MRLVRGHGINDLDIPCYDNGKQLSFYKTWCNMLNRCYYKNTHVAQPSYVSCTVCEEWLTLSNFKCWFDLNYKDGYQLDKDIIVDGNTVYSPDTCVFVPKIINTFIIDRGTERGEYLLGVSWKKSNNKFQSQCSNPLTKKYEYLGLFDCEIEAHQSWKRKKSEHVKSLVDMFPDLDYRVHNALTLKYKVEE